MCIPKWEIIANVFSNCGVRQGKHLSTITTNMYMESLDVRINDSIHFIKLQVLVYADDTVIFSQNE